MKTTWNDKWANESHRAYWNTPDQHVITFSDDCKIGSGDAVLDLGCGVGRHAIYLAQRGAQVHAIDESEAAIVKLKGSAARLHLDIKIDVCNYLPFQPPAPFDYIIAFNVIYHGNAAHFKQSILKCYDLLKPNGKLFFTCPSRRDGKYGNGDKIAEHTYRSFNSIHPGDTHYFTSEPELRDLMCQFAHVEIETDDHVWDNNGTSQFASNLIVTAHKT